MQKSSCIDLRNLNNKNFKEPLRHSFQFYLVSRYKGNLLMSTGCIIIQEHPLSKLKSHCYPKDNLSTLLSRKNTSLNSVNDFCFDNINRNT